MPDQVPVVSIREQILDAAMACITERGYDQTSFDEVAARSGISLAEIHDHFADKAEIRLALLKAWSEPFSSWLASA